jgi:hypothetical protein
MKKKLGKAQRLKKRRMANQHARNTRRNAIDARIQAAKEAAEKEEKERKEKLKDSLNRIAPGNLNQRIKEYEEQ